MINYNTIEGVSAYRDYLAASSSYLKELLTGKKFSGKQSLPVLMGSYLDMMITMPDALDNVYVESDVKRPSETITDLVDGFMTNLLFDVVELNPDINFHKAELTEYISHSEYFLNRKPESRVSEFLKTGADWWRTKVELGEKEIITSSEKALMEKAYIQLITNPEVNWLFKDDDCDIYYQREFYWTEDEVSCKGLADFTRESTDIIEVDIKYTTCPNIETWFRIMMDLNYPIQKAFYKSGLQSKGKRVVCSYWLVVSPYWTKLVPVTLLLLHHGKYGGTVKRGVYTGRFEERDVAKTIYGYKKGLILYKELQEEKLNLTTLTDYQVEELFLRNIY